MGLRRQAREIALKMLFQIDIGKLPAEEVIAHFISQQKRVALEVREYATQITRGVIQDLKIIDQKIIFKLEKWDFSRLAAVDRNVLRLAVYELLKCSDVPSKVVINEAIEIAKKYSTEDSGDFVNGILDKLA